MEIMIGNMVCRHCVAAVRRALEQGGFSVSHVELGKAEITPPDGMTDDEAISTAARILQSEDFEIITDPNSILVERIKHLTAGYVRNADLRHINLSAYLADRLNVSYDHAARVFSASQGRTIARYMTLVKVEYVKELLGERRHSLSEIADMAGYSSVAHLSRQFKEVTGVTPTAYIEAGAGGRTSAERI